MKPLALLAGAAVAGSAGLAYMMRGELQREYRILRMDDPSKVGESLTSQGNKLAYGQSDAQRKRARAEPGLAPSRPSDPSMPNVDPAG